MNPGRSSKSTQRVLRMPVDLPAGRTLRASHRPVATGNRPQRRRPRDSVDRYRDLHGGGHRLAGRRASAEHRLPVSVRSDSRVPLRSDHRSTALRWPDSAGWLHLGRARSVPVDSALRRLVARPAEVRRRRGRHTTGLESPLAHSTRAKPCSFVSAVASGLWRRRGLETLFRFLVVRDR